MNQKIPYLLVLSTYPDKTTAQQTASILITEKLAACVNIVPNVQALFMWEGRLDDADEVLLLIKTTSAKYSALESSLKKQHPYELPEIIAVPISTGFTDYLNWIDQQTQ